MKLGPEQNVNMPLKTVLSLITLVSIFTFSYFQITERLNKYAEGGWILHETFKTEKVGSVEYVFHILKKVKQ